LRIKKIKIEYVRGIESREIILDMHPNHPTIFVAPNGFGKTSIATAFNSLNRNRIELQDDDRYLNDQNAEPLIEIEDDSGNIYHADLTTNSISETFNVCVINSQVKPKASTRSFSGFAASTPSLTVEPIVLYNSIPNRSDFTYSFSEMKGRLGDSAGKLLFSLNSVISDSKFVRDFVEIKAEFGRLLQTRNSRIIELFLGELNSIHGTKQTIAHSDIDSSHLLSIEAITTISEKLNYLFNDCSQNEKLVNIIQLRDLYDINSANLTSIKNYYDYIADKTEINEMLSFFNCTWKNIKASKKDGKFVIEFPKANQISNGERDVLCFIGKLFEARSKLRKTESILIIDEIFDYLDDANLIAVQYFLTKFMNQYHESGRELFAIILTHLDPMFFNTYSFSTKNVVYLDKVQQITNKYKINNLLKERDKCKKSDKAIYDLISSNYLHYSTNNTDASVYLQSIGVETPLLIPEIFHRMAMIEFQNYRENRAYDLALVCCGLRLFVEKNAYSQLSEQDRVEFLATFKTIDKLAFAKEKGATIPEVHFLLSIIYNEAMHLDAQCQKLNPIGYKLKNKVISNMICEL
jgi:hypothetical protein